VPALGPFARWLVAFAGFVVLLLIVLQCARTAA
jgi:hypothetical protein